MALADVVGHSIYVKHWHTSSSLSTNSSAYSEMLGI